MISNPKDLAAARARWALDDYLFDDAEVALCAATCHADIRLTLKAPPYAFTLRLPRLTIHDLSAHSAFMLGFELATGSLTTWVTIHL